MVSEATYNPDEFKLSKAELVGKMDMFNSRVTRNPNVNKTIKYYIALNMGVLRSRIVSEKDMKYGLQLLCEFCDDIRAINVRRQSKELSELNPIFEKEIESKIALFPEERHSIKVDFTKALQYGAMK